MVADERGHPVELRAPEAAALVEADGIEPELGQVLVALTWTCGGSARSLE